jgi:hypothetical protein
MYTGTLIQDLIATVERAEATAVQTEITELSCLLVTLPESTNNESRYLGVA